MERTYTAIGIEFWVAVNVHSLDGHEVGNPRPAMSAEPPLIDVDIALVLSTALTTKYTELVYPYVSNLTLTLYPPAVTLGTVKLI